MKLKDPVCRHFVSGAIINQIYIEVPGAVFRWRTKLPFLLPEA